MKIHSTTVIAVRKKNKVAMMADGQATMGNIVLKGNVKKLRRFFDNKVIAGFAGSTADAFILLEVLEKKINEFNGDLTKSCIELTKIWRTDKYYQKLNATLIVADSTKTYMLTGDGNVIEPEGGVIAIGSGGIYAQSAACALYDNTNLSAEEIAEKSMEIASKLCIYTNSNFTKEVL